MTRRRAVIVHNAGAGDGDTDHRDVHRAIERHGFTVTTRGSDEASWRDEIRGADLVVVVGGDGTVRQVIVEAVGIDAPVVIVPAGTANNIARTLGLSPDEPTAHLDELDIGRTVAFDVPRMTMGVFDARFVETVGVGVFADLLAMHDAQGRESGNDEGLRHLRELVATAVARPWTVHADGSDLSGEFIAIEAMNINESGPNVPLAPAADVSDGLIDLVMVRPDDRDQLLRTIDRRMASDGPVALDLPTVRCRTIELEVPALTGVRRDDQIDGPTSGGTLRITVDGTSVPLVGVARSQRTSDRCNGSRSLHTDEICT